MFVIERADVIKKAAKLGFPGLMEQSSPAELGAAIVQHWNEKIRSSQAEQSITNSYEGILLKTIKGYEYIYCEFPINPLDPNAFSWAWTVNKVTGRAGECLQGYVAGKRELVWYKNQKQLFRARTIPPEAFHIRVNRTRITLDRYVQTVLSALQDQLSTQSFDSELGE